VLWALAQPAAMAGLVAAFVIGVGLRSAAQWSAARWLDLAGPGRNQRGGRVFRIGGAGGRARLDPLGVMAACLSGTGWGRPAASPASRRERWAVLAGPAAVLLASQAAFAAYHSAYPRMSLPLRLNRPSDVLHGALAPTTAAQLMLSVAVGLLCFGLVALLPVPPFDGYRLFDGHRLLGGGRSGWLTAVERIAVVAVFALTVVPVAGRPPVLMALDTIAGPLVRFWA
jgi:Zn-dependent protease